MIFKRKEHQNTGLLRGRLNPCPDSPNCQVSMYPQDTAHYQKPWFYHKERSEVMEILTGIIEAESRAEVQVRKDHYLHVVYTIPVLKYKDDLEFYLPEGEKTIHFRSASRVGYSDLGVNARRLKRIRNKLSDRIIITI